VLLVAWILGLTEGWVARRVSTGTFSFIPISKWNGDISPGVWRMNVGIGLGSSSSQDGQDG